MEDIATFVEPSTLEFFTNLRATKLMYITQRKTDNDISTEDRYLQIEVNIFVRSDIGYDREQFPTEIKKMPHGSLRTLKELLSQGIAKKLIDKGDKVLCVVDESLGIGYKGVSFVFDIDHVLVNISKHHLSDNVPSEIIEAIIDIATEIATEGREGKKIGTAFIIGDKTELLKYDKQLVLNPFLCYLESNITSCAYLDVPTEGIDLPGLGTKHLNCAAITKHLDSFAFVVSSTGTIRIFKEGKVIMKI